jgi:hypothetical protein
MDDLRVLEAKELALFDLDATPVHTTSRSFGWKSGCAPGRPGRSGRVGLSHRESMNRTAGLCIRSKFPMRARAVMDKDRRVPKSIGKPVSSPGFEVDLFEMANLFPLTTGLPMTVWVSPRGKARHDVRVTVNRTHGNQMDASNTALVGVRPSPHIVAGRLAPADEQAVSAWISLNVAPIIGYSNGLIDTIQLGQQLRLLP